MPGLRQLWHTSEFRTIAPLALIAGLLVLFVQITGEVLDGDTHSFDSRILLALRTADPADPIGPHWFELVMTDLTALGGHTLLTIFCAITMGYLFLHKRAASAWLVAGSALGGMAFNHLLKTVFDRPRPDVVAHLAEVHTLSFPSGHAMLSAIIYLTLGVLLARSQSSKRLKGYILGVAITATLLVGISRIYLGVHWPTDVLAGWAVGAAWAIGCLQLARLLRKTESPVSHI